MKLDLGCGTHKHPDFYGIDRRPHQDVDLVWDLNEGLPLPDESVEWVMACRFLPYVHDLQAMLTEIYRVSIHKAIVCILVPYAHSFKHSTNPLLRHRFDEHTPRHFTNCFFQPSHGPVSPALSPYENLDELPYDFRLLRMEYFYNESLRAASYESEELEDLHRIQVNVVDEILYHFVVIKEEVTPSELEQLSRHSHMEPHCAHELRSIPSPLDFSEEEPLLSDEGGIRRPKVLRRTFSPRHFPNKTPQLLTIRKRNPS
ncbi:hypothetical protein [Gorillibacterium sp. CAU 1737]|uniref:class I SAM-dependent methyltransferase n=1 Tax=Gorillibacterium sp. CAU 1737 TaxID=3140362 RepID=UPI0032604BA0